MIDWEQTYSRALSYDDFLQQHASPGQMQQWSQSLARVQLSDDQQALVQRFRRKLHVLCMAGAWCGDCIEQGPILQRVALESEHIEVRFVDRDADPLLQEALLLCGAPRVPQAVFLSEDFAYVGRFGDKTLTQYRELGATTGGAVCSTGLVPDGIDPIHAGIVQDWLNEFERAHWIVRLSPRLRQIHGD